MIETWLGLVFRSLVRVNHSRSWLRCAAAMTGILLLIPITSSAQRSIADYERSDRMRKGEQPTVYRDRVDPQWIDEGHFWYRVTTGPSQHEFVRVDATQGTREPLFDHEQLAVALAERLGQPTDSKRLPLVNLSVSGDFEDLQFTVGSRRFQFEIHTSKLHDLENSAETENHDLIPIGDVPAASRTTGGETHVTFVNETRGSVRLFWRDSAGRKVAYATIESGQEHTQHTYAGHVWEITAGQSQSLAGFIARESSSRVVIGLDLPKSAARLRTQPAMHSPDGTWIVEFREHNLWLRTQTPDPGDESTDFALTKDGTEEDAYSGPVHWSPDSRWLLVFQTRPPEQHVIHTIESAPHDRLQPRLHSIDYLKPGDRIAHPRLRLFDVSSKSFVPISDDLFPTPWSISQVAWDSDSQRFTFLYNQRGHQILRVIAVDTAGTTQVIIDETAETFIDYHAKNYFQRLETTDEILWMSERDGWNHLWLYAGKTGEVRNQVTRGSWVVRRVEFVDEDRRQIWFLAGGVRPEQDPYYLHLCRVNFDGTGLTVLTEGDGTHEITFSPNREYFLDRWSRVDQPPTTELRRADDGRRICELERADHRDLLATGWDIPERFSAVGRDGTTPIHGLIIRPSTFDPALPYPVVEQIYAGPHGAHVPKAFGTLSGQHAIAELGFIVVQIDGMGTNWRSKAFHDVCWKNLADAGFPDRIAWIKAAAATRPWMDLERVGIYGGSAGGQNAMRALIDHHEFYKVAVADCGCHDNRMDKIWWNELWMGHPVGPHYEASSNVVHAHRMRGKLMLIVGELDRNVDPASTMQVVRALQQADRDFELVVMAGTGHGAAETPYGSRRRSDFLVRHLHGREPIRVE